HDAAARLLELAIISFRRSRNPSPLGRLSPNLLICSQSSWLSVKSISHRPDEPFATKMFFRFGKSAGRPATTCDTAGFQASAIDSQSSSAPKARIYVDAARTALRSWKAANIGAIFARLATYVCREAFHPAYPTDPARRPPIRPAGRVAATGFMQG